MKMNWNAVKFGLVLFALPLVATAAASAHQWMTDNAPISTSVAGIAVDTEVIGNKRVHTVAINQNGVVEGRLAAINAETKAPVGLAELKVFFVQNGEVVQEAVTTADGRFSIAGLAEGAYSFIATGENGFAAYGVRVVADSTGKFDNVMEAAAVSPQFSQVKNILDANLPATVAEAIENAQPSDVQVVGANKVKLEDGTLTGHVVPMFGDVDTVAGTSVHILQNNAQVATVQADEKGSFMVNDLEPGVYDFVAAGPSGFAAVSFEAVQEEGAAQSVADIVDSEEVAVSVEPAATVADPIAYQDAMPADIPVGSLDVCLTCGNDNMIVGQQLGYAGSEIVYDSTAPIEYAAESIGCGCAAGGCCGSAGDFASFSSCNTGCGGGGLLGRGRLFGGGFAPGGGGLLGGGGLAGGAGLGRLALLGGLAVGIVGIADDNNPQEGTPVN